MITVKGLTRYYGDVKAVDGIDFEIEKGEIVGLLGPNGAGKTTTLRVLTGYIRPTSGTVVINRKRLEENLIGIKKEIGYLPESAPLYSDMIVYDYLKYIASIQEVPNSKVEERILYVVDKCGLKQVINKKIGELSKGYRQRVGLGHAIIHDPEILILDEPTSGLDPNQIVEIRDLIRELGKHKTVILSTHILSEVEAVCGRIIIINRGKIVADDLTSRLIREKQSTGTIKLIIKTDDDKKEIEDYLSIKGIDKIEVNKQKNMKEVYIYSHSPNSIIEELYQRIKKSNWILYEMSQEKNTLESIFQELTKEA